MNSRVDLMHFVLHSLFDGQMKKNAQIFTL